jgi:hypothetical protein
MAGQLRQLCNLRQLWAMVFGANDTRERNEYAHAVAFANVMDNNPDLDPQYTDYDDYTIRGELFAPKGDPA